MPSPTTNRKLRLLLTLTVVALVALALWLYDFLQPGTWRYYTDGHSTRQLARDVTPRPVLWEKAQPLAGDEIVPSEDIQEPAIAPDGTRMIFTRGATAGNADLYLAHWDGRHWNGAEPMRALNSKFNERSPAFSRDSQYLYFSTDRPGGLGGYDVWIARWDGAEYAWPQPLDRMVNSPFDEFSPSPAADDKQLYFSSNRPSKPLTKEDDKLSHKQLREKYARTDFDVFAANRFPVGYTNRTVERATSLLYSLRQAALTDPVVMEKLGGSKDSEMAVNRALQWLAANQETNGHWSITRSGGQPGHDVATTAFALLAFYGHGERHDQPCQYRDTVTRGLRWLLAKQNKLTGDLRETQDGRGKERNGNAMYDQGIATLALTEAYGVTKDPDLFDAAQSAIYFLADAQHKAQGGWRYVPEPADTDLSVSGWVIMALESAQMSGVHVSPKTLTGVRKFLKSVATGAQGGHYAYMPGNERSTAAMTAVGFFCSQLMGLPANTPRAFESGAFLMNTPLTSDDVYYSYYGTLAAYQNQGPSWRAWNKALQTKILAAQSADGSWSAGGQFGSQMGRVITTSLLALSLEAHYRYTPLYGLGFEPAKNPAQFSTLALDQLPPVPEYDRARPLRELNSSADERYVSASSHGDFLFVASNRAGGYGGFDLYRARLSGDDAGAPVNLGPAINSAADDTTPCANMAGFQVVFSSNRGAAKDRYQLLSATSRIVSQRYHYTRPDLAWVWENQRTPLLFALVGLLVLGTGVTRICLQQRATRKDHA
jgi:hypothetical protein